MAELNPRVPQVNDPELEAALNRLLTIVGPLGRLNVADTVLPTVSLGEVSVPLVEATQPVFTSGEIFTAGAQVGPVAGTILADTGQLAAGTFDIIINYACTDAGVHNFLEIQHRNAANAANIVEWETAVRDVTNHDIKYATTFAVDERLRVLVGANASGGTRYSATIWAARRT